MGHWTSWMARVHWRGLIRHNWKIISDAETDTWWTRCFQLCAVCGVCVVCMSHPESKTRTLLSFPASLVANDPITGRHAPGNYFFHRGGSWVTDVRLAPIHLLKPLCVLNTFMLFFFLSLINSKFCYRYYKHCCYYCYRYVLWLFKTISHNGNR